MRKEAGLAAEKGRSWVNSMGQRMALPRASLLAEELVEELDLVSA